MSSVNPEQFSGIVAKVARIFKPLRKFSEAKDLESAENLLIQCLKNAGFPSGRLYYIDEKGTLGLARWFGRNLKCHPKKAIELKQAQSALGVASYAVLKHRKPLVVKVRPGEKQMVRKIQHDSGIPYLQIPSATLHSYFRLPKTRDWIDFPLIDDDNRCFGKFSLDPSSRSRLVEHSEFSLLSVLNEPITAAISACCWFSGTSLPLGFGTEFWKRNAEQPTLLDFTNDTAQTIVRLLNARNCSVFVVHSPQTNGVDLNQCQKLVLWSTTFAQLATKKALLGYYQKGEGLTGWTWQNRQWHFEEDIHRSEHWHKGVGKLNDSKLHKSWAASVIVGNSLSPIGLVRVPEGKRRTLLKAEAILLNKVAVSLIGPAMERVIEKEKVQAIGFVISAFERRLKSILSSMKPVEDITVWQFVQECCFGIFCRTDSSSRTKKFLLNRINGAKIEFFQSAGGLRVNSVIANALANGISAGSASSIVRRFEKSILLTDLKAAEKAGAYIPLVEGAVTAAIVPLEFGKDLWGSLQ